MARDRQCSRLPIGEYQGSAFWQSGSGIEGRTRYAEGVGIKIEEKWVYLYLRDGEEVVRLRRQTNKSAQIYLDMTLHDAVKERVVNQVTHGSSCCIGGFGRARPPASLASLYSGEDSGVSEDSPYIEPCVPCPIHTAAWLEREIQAKLDAVVTDEDWPSVLAQRKLAAVLEREREEALKKERAAAREAGVGEWRKVSGTWLVTIDGHRVGDIVTVRRQNGTVSRHELIKQVSPTLFECGDAISEAET